MKVLISTLFTIFLSLFSIHAQETGTVQGKIISADGFPLNDISIKFEKATITSKTASNGEFVFKNFPTGIHTITLEGIGLTKQSKEIRVITNEVTRVEFILNENINTLKEIVIKIKDSPNKKKETVLSGLEIKPFDLPQSIQIIGNATLTQQQTLRLSDVAKNINGVYIGSARGGAQESLWSRGYDMTANNMFKNGFRLNSGSMPEVATLEKVEVLKGGSALLFGNVTPGGILNMVTKIPQFKKGGEISLQMGSYSFYKPTVDFYGTLTKNSAYRFVGTYENAGSFRDNVTRERIYINPSVLLKASKKTEIILQGDYLKDNWIPDFGTGSIGKVIADVPRNNYLGATWSNGQTYQSSVSGLVKHTINDNWKLNFNTAFQNYERTWEGTERIQPLANGDWNRPLGKNKTIDQLISNQINLQGNFTTGKIKHQFFAGIDADNSNTQVYTFVYNPAIYDMINIFDLSLYPQNTTIPEARNTKIVTTNTNRFGIYAQDLISITDKFKVLTGLRWSWQEAKAENQDLVANVVAEDAKRINTAISPKLGLVFQPTKNISLFTSYSNSFLPNTGVNINNETLKASIIDQYEMGVKKDFWRGLISTNITLYQIINSNLAQTAEFNSDGTINTNTNIKSLNGETKSQGIEIDITAKPIEGMSILAGYSYNDMRFSKTSGLTGSFIVGDRLVRTPENTANLSGFYTIPSGKLKGISIGAMGNHIGKREGGWNNTIGQTIPDRMIPLKGFTTFDFSLGYNWNHFSILCKLSNITNELNYTVHENYSINPISPRQIMTSINYKF
jgi:iron complex outermembrane receptor protein